MRRTVTLVTAWVAATIGAVALAFASVGVVADQVLSPPPLPVVGSAAAQATASASDDPSDGPSDDPSGDPSADDDSSEAPTSAPTGSSTASPTTTATPRSAPTGTSTPRPTATATPTASSTPSSSPSSTPSSSPSSNPSSSPTSSPSSSPTSSPTSSAPAETRTYRLVGGTVTIRFSADRVTVTSATPNAGFELHEIEQPGATVIDLEFRAHDDSHRSKLDAWWDNGPRERVREETRD